MSQPNVSPPPVSFERQQVGLREISLLLIAAGFAALMFDQPRIAVITGWAVVVVWVVALVRGPRLSPMVTVVLGTGLFVTTMWWTRQDWWHAAIALLWIGIGLVAIGLAGLARTRLKDR